MRVFAFWAKAREKAVRLVHKGRQFIVREETEKEKRARLSMRPWLWAGIIILCVGFVLMAHPQTLPQSVPDAASSENLEYLHQEIRKERSARVNDSQTTTGSNIHNGTETFNSSTTFNGGVFGTLFRSTFTTLGAGESFSNTTWVGLRNSTLTLAMNGGRAFATFSCHGRTDSAAGNCTQVGLLIGGQLAFGMTGGAGGLGLSKVCADVLVNIGFVHMTTGTYSGNVQFAVARKVDGTSTGNINNDGSSACQFQITEIR